ncbi:ribosomal protein L20 [Dehalogenimonas lykanthroporepellens BL-DC-9]|jgi:large subunit ribosomal protein L20|nr:ribosomal protein L20 [Dehalogenimonas lykanthroporepellens BL-DC-9]
MARIKGGVATKKRHKSVLALTKGHSGQRNHNYRRAKESQLHALAYAHAHRRDRKGDFRRLWIARINAAARLNGLTYSQFMAGLAQSGVELNRKVLADLAVTQPEAFAELAKSVKA